MANKRTTIYQYLTSIRNIGKFFPAVNVFFALQPCKWLKHIALEVLVTYKQVESQNALTLIYLTTRSMSNLKMRLLKNL